MMETKKYNREFDNMFPISIIRWTPRPFLEPYHWHSALEIGYCLKGQGRFYFGNKVFEVNPGDVFIVNNVERHIAQSQEMNPCEFYFLYFSATVIDQLEPELILPFMYNPLHFQNRIDGESEIAKYVGERMVSIFSEENAKSPGYRSMICGLLTEICVSLLRHYSTNQSREEWYQVRNSHYKLQPALEFIKEHYAEPISLEDVAASISLSPSRTRHLFKDTFGEGFREYLMHHRIAMAERLLLESDQSILDICFQSGFQSSASFYRAFKIAAGVTPQQYRERTICSRK